MVSGGHCTSTSIVSYCRLISTTTPFLIICIVSTSLILIVSRMATLFVMMVVSTLTVVFRTMLGSLAIARFRCQLAPQLLVSSAMVTSHKNRTPRGCRCCTAVVLFVLTVLPIGQSLCPSLKLVYFVLYFIGSDVQLHIQGRLPALHFLAVYI